MEKRLKDLNVSKKKFSKICNELSEKDELFLHHKCGEIIYHLTTIKEKFDDNILLDNFENAVKSITKYKFSFNYRVCEEFQCVIIWIEKFMVSYFHEILNRIEPSLKISKDILKRYETLQDDKKNLFQLLKKSRNYYYIFFNEFEKIKFETNISSPEKNFLFSLRIDNFSTYKSAFTILTYRLKDNYYFLEIFNNLKGINFDFILTNSSEKQKFLDLVDTNYELFYDSYKKYSKNKRKNKLKS